MIFGADISGALAAAVMLVSAPAGLCPSAAPVKVSVHFEHKQNPVEKKVTSQALTAQMRQVENAPDSANAFATEAHWMVGGLNSSNLRTGYQMPYLRRDSKDGMSCIMPQAFNYTITYENTIYIAEDFRLMGCRYSATMAHEKRHEKTDLKILEDHADAVRKALEKAVSGLRPIGPIPTQNVEAEYARRAAELAAYIQPLHAQMMDERRKKHAVIDSYENYMRDTALCPEQFPRFEQDGE